MNRRQFLAALGLGSGSLVLPSGKPVLASPTEAPQRFLVFFTQHGTWYDGWKMGAGTLPSNQEWELDLTSPTSPPLSDALLPLSGFRDRLLILDGLALVSAEADISGLRHEVGQVQALTGAPVELVTGVPLGSQPSIDQRVAAHIRRADRYRSLELAVGDPPMSVIYSGRRQQLPYESNPLRVYERLFGLSDNQSNSNDLLAQAQSSLLSQVAERHDALAKRLSGEDRQKLELHRDLVRDLETRVTGLAGLSCESLLPSPTGSENYEETFEAMAHMVVSAFSCDLTRVASLHMAELPIDLVVPGYSGSLHDELAHAVWVDPYAAQVMTDYTAIHAAQFARVLELLDSIPEGNGSMLDNTLCLWVSELGDPTHGFEKWAAVMAGGQAFQMGRYLHFPSDTPFEGWNWDGTLPAMGRPHQQLLTSILQAFGMSDNAVGTESVTGIDGVSIDCTGPLPGLT